MPCVTLVGSVILLYRIPSSTMKPKSVSGEAVKSPIAGVYLTGVEAQLHRFERSCRQQHPENPAAIAGAIVRMETLFSVSIW